MVGKVDERAEIDLGGATAGGGMLYVIMKPGLSRSYAGLEAETAEITALSNCNA